MSHGSLAVVGPMQTGSFPEVELVLEGRMPLGSVRWVEQYARSLASPDQPTAVLSFHGAIASLSVVVSQASEPADSAAARHGAPVKPSPSGAPAGGISGQAPVAGVVDSLAALLARRHAPGRVLVHVAEADPAVARPILQAVRRWTLLTGADPASIASTFRIAKRALQMAGERALPRIGVVAVAADPGPAADAAGMLNTIIQPLIRRRVELVGIQRRSYPLRAMKLAETPADQSCWAACCELLSPGLRDGAPTILSGRLRAWLDRERPKAAGPAAEPAAQVA